VASQASYPPRKLVADVLRDWPGQCFGSTACQVFPVNAKWSLFPFCGQATCLSEGSKLYESVEECRRPKPKAECTIFEPTKDPKTVFPNCCPVQQCPEGVTVEYYTQAEAEEEAKKDAAAAAAASTQGGQQ